VIPCAVGSAVATGGSSGGTTCSATRFDQDEYRSCFTAVRTATTTSWPCHSAAGSWIEIGAGCGSSGLFGGGSSTGYCFALAAHGSKSKGVTAGPIRKSISEKSLIATWSVVRAG